MFTRISCVLLTLLLVPVPITHAQWEDQQAGPNYTWAQLPQSPFELATGPLQILTTPQERSAAFELLDRARQNYNFYVEHGPAFVMRASFMANGQAEHEGAGSLEETWLSNRQFRWVAQLGGIESGRFVSGGHRWSVNRDTAIPLRVQMVKAALFWPVEIVAPRAHLRRQDVNYNGTQLTCILNSGSLGTPPPGRHWVEGEFCIEPRTGELRIWSPAPGMYVIYDYKNVLQFHGHVIASEISFFESSGTVLQIHVESFGDASIAGGLGETTGQMQGQAEAPGNAGPMRFPRRVWLVDSGAATAIQPVLVHASLSPEGEVLEAEALQTTDLELARRAIEEVAEHPFRTGRQQEVLVNVEFFVARLP